MDTVYLICLRTLVIIVYTRYTNNFYFINEIITYVVLYTRGATLLIKIMNGFSSNEDIKTTYYYRY